jgi:hypothetical protein
MVRIPTSALLQGMFSIVICTLPACVQPPAFVVQGATGEVVPLGAWTATLAGVGETTSLRGTATVAPGRTISETQAHVTLTGATPSAAHPWFLQLGDCGNDRGVLGGLMAYPPIMADEQGEARLTVTLPFTMPTTGHYFVSVRRSEALVSTVIACGNLTRAGDAPVLQTAAR